MFANLSWAMPLNAPSRSQHVPPPLTDRRLPHAGIGSARPLAKRDLGLD